MSTTQIYSRFPDFASTSVEKITTQVFINISFEPFLVFKLNLQTDILTKILD